MDNPDAMSDPEFKRYTEKLLAVEGCAVEKSTDGSEQIYTFSTKHEGALKVRLIYVAKDEIFLDVEGVDTSYWHTYEEENLDYHIGLAMSALTGDVKYNRSTILGRKEICFKTDGGWDCTLTDSAGSYHYITHRKRLRREIK